MISVAAYGARVVSSMTTQTCRSGLTHDAPNGAGVAGASNASCKKKSQRIGLATICNDQQMRYGAANGVESHPQAKAAKDGIPTVS